MAAVAWTARHGGFRTEWQWDTTQAASGRNEMIDRAPFDGARHVREIKAGLPAALRVAQRVALAGGTPSVPPRPAAERLAFSVPEMRRMDDFHTQLIARLPKLRLWAWALTRDQTMSEDLVQDTMVCALRSRDSFTLGTNLQAWLHRILYNQFISALRRRRETRDLDEVSEEHFAIAPQYENQLVLKELRRAFWRLQSSHRELLVMLLVQGMTYDDIAAATGLPAGTIKSRVSRARMQMRLWLLGEDGPATQPDRAGRRNSAPIRAERVRTRDPDPEVRP